MTSRYHERFEEIGKEIYNVLKFFSLDLCEIICRYTVHGKCRQDAQPVIFKKIVVEKPTVLLFAYNSKNESFLVADWNEKTRKPIVSQIDVNGKWLKYLTRSRDGLKYPIKSIVLSSDEILLLSYGQIYVTDLTCDQKLTKKPYLGVQLKNITTMVIGTTSLFGPDTLACYDETQGLILLSKDTFQRRTFPMSFYLPVKILLHSSGNIMILLLKPTMDKCQDIVMIRCDEEKCSLPTLLDSMKIFRPIDIALDRYSNLYILTSNNEIMVYSILHEPKRFVYLTQFPLNKSAPCFCVDQDNRIMVSTYGEIEFYVFES